MVVKKTRLNKNGQMRVVEALLACIIIITGFTVSAYFSSTYLVARQAQMESTSINVAGLLGSQILLEKIEKQEGDWQQDLKSCLQALLPANTYYTLTITSEVQNRQIAQISNVNGENVTSGMNTASARQVITVTLPIEQNVSKQLDVMLILDRSGSMGDTLTGDTISKIVALKSASEYFVNSLNMSTCRVGLSSFSTTPSLDVHLTSNSASVNNKIQGLTASGDTCMGGAIKLAAGEFMKDGRPDTSWVAIIISDGVPNIDWNGQFSTQRGQQYAIQQAENLSSLGASIYTIGLGSKSNFNETFLKAIQTDGYYYSPSVQQLSSIYDSIRMDMLYKANFDVLVLELTVMTPGG